MTSLLLMLFLSVEGKPSPFGLFGFSLGKTLKEPTQMFLDDINGVQATVLDTLPVIQS